MEENDSKDRKPNNASEASPLLEQGRGNQPDQTSWTTRAYNATANATTAVANGVHSFAQQVQTAAQNFHNKPPMEKLQYTTQTLAGLTGTAATILLGKNVVDANNHGGFSEGQQIPVAVEGALLVASFATACLAPKCFGGRNSQQRNAGRGHSQPLSNHTSAGNVR